MINQSKLSRDAIEKILQDATVMVERDGHSDDGQYVVQTLIKIVRDRLENLKFDNTHIVDKGIVLTIEQAEEILERMYCGIRGVNPPRDLLQHLIANAKMNK